ncbi:copper resistance protein CopC [Actinoplanes sp. TRM 88003]|uniref:Copper resistance protein CopC n=1 Tax=Paractinoplanes aksuensis TaxID=2939490 RepID=A0ABT1DZ70_9ACTN|nr:copper resistance protein CopC [Actinoplanes aksuensis]MCO8276183.1 copper resistance protein CopC [Actinoplanes aksuensis]
MIRRLLVLLLASAVMLLGLSEPAYAHANLVSADPAEGAVLTTAPDQVVFTFDEAVRGVPDGVQVFDPQGDLVEATATVGGAKLEVALPDQLGNGTTVITWRVVSDDGHPVGGALTFSVGAPTPVVTPPAAGVPEVPWTLTLARWLGYVSLFLASGLVLFVALFLPTGVPRRRLVTGARVAAAVAAVAWLVMLPLTLLYLYGQVSAWSSLPPTEYAVTAAVVGGSALAVVLLNRRRGAAVSAAAIAVMAPAFVGHTRAATPEVLVIGADMLHLLAGSVWLGGLVGLALTLPGLSGRGGAAADVLARFSTAAAGVLAALVATGSLLAWRILGSWSALVDTSYGQLLLVKIGIVAVALAIAGWNRWSLVPRRRPVLRAIAVEGAILIVALLLTGFLVDTSPESTSTPARAAAEANPGVRTTTLGDIEVQATLAPLRRGTNTITLKLSSEGVAPPVVRLTSDRAGLGEVPLKQVSAGNYTASVVLPAPGTWRMQVSLRVSEFANPVAELDFEVNG